MESIPPPFHETIDNEKSPNAPTSPKGAGSIEDEIRPDEQANEEAKSSEPESLPTIQQDITGGSRERSDSPRKTDVEQHDESNVPSAAAEILMSRSPSSSIPMVPVQSMQIVQPVQHTTSPSAYDSDRESGRQNNDLAEQDFSEMRDRPEEDSTNSDNQFHAVSLKRPRNLVTTGLDPGSSLGNESTCLDQDASKMNDGVEEDETSSSGESSSDDEASQERADADDSGDYSPSRRPARKPRRKPTKPRSKQKDVAAEADPDPESLSDDEELKGLVACLRFPSAKGKARYEDFLSKILSEEKSKENGYHFRRRGRSDDKKLLTIEGATLSSDYDERAKPFARGCRECVSHGERCSMLDHEKNWPCDRCREANDDCDLIVSPVRKITCRTCKRYRKSCSYTNTRNHDGPCLQCDQVGIHCVAGPVKEFVRPRIRYPAKGEPDPVSKKKGKKGKTPEDCIECDEANRKCSYATPYDGGACMDCRRLNLLCTISDVSVASQPGPAPAPTRAHDRSMSVQASADSNKTMPSTGHQAQAQALSTRDTGRNRDDKVATTETSTHSSPVETGNRKKRPRQSSSHSRENDQKRPRHSSPPPKSERNPTMPTPHQQAARTTPNSPQPSHPQPSQPKGKISKIKTSYRHPMTFNCDQLPTDPTPCSFCSNRSLPFTGYGVVKPTIMSWFDGRAITELSGGHKENGIERTSLCTNCTTERMSILTCGRHKLQQTRATPPTKEENEEAADAAVDGEVPDWEDFCSLCSNLKSLECGDEDCELRLCVVCCEAVEGEYPGSLEQMLKETPQDPSDERPVGLRADCELLTQDGPLMRWVRYTNMIEAQEGMVVM